MDIVLKIGSNELQHARVCKDHFDELCRAFESEHTLSSDEFLRKFDDGELGDDAYLFDWFAAKRGLNLWQQRFLILSGFSL
ncbi:MAG: hypothetical protein HY328_10080 [Chloroflexi bacterium]|nr:hypothetical protein [Chloroflexota bacterium]